MGFLEIIQAHLPSLQPAPTAAERASQIEAQPAGRAVLNRANPLGNFDYVQVPFEPPRSFLPDTTQPLGAPRWFFADCSRPQLCAVFSQCGLPAEQEARLLQPERWQSESNGFWISPPVELLLELSPPARARLYSILANHPANSAQCRPFRFRPEAFEAWLDGAGLEADEARLLRQLTYRQGPALCFCDGAILQGVMAPGRFRLLVKALYAENTLVMRLHVTPGMDFDALVRYWKRGGHVESLRPFLESLARLPGGGTVNVSCLLPDFAQERLYTYAAPARGDSEELQNCFWSAMNFFNTRPDDRFLDAQQVGRTLHTDYDQITGAPVFGDLVLLLDGVGRPVHLCVYLADDVVFTKNGRAGCEPWVLMKLPDVRATYASKVAAQSVMFRAKKA